MDTTIKLMREEIDKAMKEKVKAVMTHGPKTCPVCKGSIFKIKIVWK